MALPVTTTGSMSAMHGYTRAGSDMARVADESRVHELLLQRLQAKKNHKFEVADELRNVLLTECAVEVFDNTKFWRVVGGRAHVPLPQGVSKPRSKPPGPKPGGVRGPSNGDAMAEPPPSRLGAKALRKKEQAAAEQAAETPIASGFGHTMLLKMGWGGRGRGLREGGIAEPFQILPAEAGKIIAAGKRGLVADADAQQAAAGQGPASSVDGVTSACESKKRKKRKDRGTTEGAATVADGGFPATDEVAEEQPTGEKPRKRKRKKGASASGAEPSPPLLRPERLATHPAFDAICEMKSAEDSLTAKQVHALLPGRGFDLSLAVVKKLCSEAALVRARRMN